MLVEPYPKDVSNLASMRFKIAQVAFPYQHHTSIRALLVTRLTCANFDQDSLVVPGPEQCARVVGDRFGFRKPHARTRDDAGSARETASGSVRGFWNY